ncbi:MAG: hypothetical protein ABSD48_13125 [Armatimonadota bacterium]|jgi:hypothetical protein
MKLYHKTPLLPLVLAVVLFGALAVAALSSESAAPAPAAVQSASADPDALDWTGTAQKWVPIISVEQGGLSVGAAQIAGPTAQVEKVKAVAQLRLEFKSIARIYAYIPVATLSVTKLDRVQGVSVWATGDLRIIKF